MLWGYLLRIIKYKRISSTNTKSKSLAEEGAAEWTVVVSEVQTEGRGRSGRTWDSPKGGLWFSVIIRPKIPVEQIPVLRFLFANALREGVERVSTVHPEVKWPNDLVVNSKKLAGILIETKISGSKVVYAIVGVGLNVNLAAKELPLGATSIFIDTSQKIGLEDTLSSVLSAFAEHYGSYWDPKSIISDWWNYCAHRMKPVTIKTGKRLVKGKNIGVNSDGSIVIEMDNRIITVTDGTLGLDT